MLSADQVRRYYRQGLSPSVVRMIGGGVPAWVLSSGGTPATLDIDFVNDRAWNAAALASIPSLLSCTRASTGYYTKADGTLTSFLSNVLRYGTNGLLVEEARTNSCLQSQTFQTTWGLGTLASAVADQYAAPDGTTTADQLLAGAGSNNHFWRQSGIATAAAAQTLSIYVKYDNHRWFLLQGHDGTNTFAASFDLLNGVVGAKTASTTSAITALANGWYRLEMTATFASSASSGIFYLIMNDLDQATARVWNAVGTEKIAIWGAQWETGAFATSYIPTTSSSATRAEDQVSGTAGGFVGAAAGTIYVAGTPFASTSAVANLGTAFSLNTNTNNELIIYRNTTTVHCDVTDGGVAQVNANHGTAWGALAARKLALAYATNDFSFTHGGAAVTTDASGTVPSVSGLGIGNRPNGGGLPWNGYISEVAYWNSRLANAALQTLTT